MNHRRYVPQSRKPQPIELLPFRNNHQRLKQIYEGPQLFKDKNKELNKRDSKQKEQLSFRQDPVRESKHRPQLQQLNLAEVKSNNRYKEAQKQQRDNHQGYQSQDNRGRKNQKQQIPLTTRHKEQLSSEKNDLFKIRRKSISGSLKKKIKQQTIQYLSANPVLPLELNCFQEARKMYKEGKISEALKLFELTVQKQPELPDGYYYSALCHLSKHNYAKADKIFTIMFEKFKKQSKKTIYLFAAIAAKNINEYEKALRILTEGVSQHSDYIDLYLYRAKLFKQDKKYEEAHQDYQNVLKIRKNCIEALYNNAICLKELGKINNCLSTLNSAFYSDQNGEYKSLILLERIKIYISQNKYKECKKDILKLQELQPQNCELHYYKGLLQIAQNNKKSSLISFQRCIRSNTSKQAVASSLIEIAKSKTQDRDFYSAYYHINRSGFLQISTPQIEKFKLFAEGVVFMMKRKINEGIQNFYKLQQLYNPIGPYFEKLYYLYRAYGHFMQNKHVEAIQDYQKAQKFIPKDKYISYNKLIAEGIVLVNNKNFNGGLQKFDQAQVVASSASGVTKIEPLIYRAMTFIEKIKAKQNNKEDDLQTLEEIFIALKQLDKAYDVSDSNSNMLYLRSLIYMYLNKTDDGLQDIIKAISKSQQNVAKYFYFRALAHQTMNNKKQALNDFNICVNLDQKFSKVYLERAKLLFSNDQAAKGLEDLHKYKQLDPKVDIKLIECSLFYIIKEYDLAESCLQLIEDQNQKRKLQVLLKIKQMQVVQAKQKMKSPADAMICDIMMGKWSTNETEIDTINIFTRVDYYCYMGIKYYHLGQFEESITYFTYAIKQKGLMDLEQNSQNNYEQTQQEEQDLLQIQIQSQTKGHQKDYLNYNLFLAYLAAKQHKKAYEVFIRDILPAKEHFLRSQTVGSLSRLLFQTMKVKQNDKNKEKQLFEFVLFRSLIGETTDYVEIQLPNFILKTRLCYPMPYAKQIFTQYSPKINPSYILECLRINQVENKPEPPWVKRSNQDLFFTNDVIDINIEFQNTEQDESQKEQEQYQGEGQQGEAEQEEGEQSRQQEQQTEKDENEFDPRKFRQQMKLDDEIERKLQKIMKDKKKSR